MSVVRYLTRTSSPSSPSSTPTARRCKATPRARPALARPCRGPGLPRQGVAKGPAGLGTASPWHRPFWARLPGRLAKRCEWPGWLGNASLAGGPAGLGKAWPRACAARAAGTAGLRKAVPRPRPFLPRPRRAPGCTKRCLAQDQTDSLRQCIALGRAGRGKTLRWARLAFARNRLEFGRPGARPWDNALFFSARLCRGTGPGGVALPRARRPGQRLAAGAAKPKRWR